MSSAFVKEGEAGRLKDVAPALGALLFHPVNAEGKCRRTIARIGVPVTHRKHLACCGRKAWCAASIVFSFCSWVKSVCRPVSCCGNCSSAVFIVKLEQ